MAAHQAPQSLGFSSKNTGVGCHFLLQCMKVKSESEVAQFCPTPSDPMDCSLPAPPSMGFSRQEYWSRLPLPPQKKLRKNHGFYYMGLCGIVICLISVSMVHLSPAIYFNLYVFLYLKGIFRDNIYLGIF